MLAGHSRFENDPVEREIDDIHVGLNASVVGVAGWRLTLPRMIVSQRLLAADNHFRNQNTRGLELDNGRDRQLAYRADATVSVASVARSRRGRRSRAPRQQPRPPPSRRQSCDPRRRSTTIRATAPHRRLCLGAMDAVHDGDDRAGRPRRSLDA